MYHTFDKAAVCSLLGVTTDDTPKGLILHGAYDMPRLVQQWRDRLTNARVAQNAFNLVIGEYRGATVWYAPLLGAPMAAMVTHCAAVAGAQCIVQIGSYGGTRRGLAIGDLLLVTGAERGEAASDWYAPLGQPVGPDERLMNWFRAALAQRELPWHEGTVFTTPAFMAEKWEDVLRWEQAGYVGVEMEAATTFAVAQHFGVPSACLIYLLDNLIEELHILDNTLEDRMRIRQARKLISDLALEAVVSFQP